MKTLNAKRITAVAAGAALLGLGLAFAGPVTFQNVPIISNSGQPVVQIVIGSQAKPSDGVAAANIAAAIGNLAYTSVPVTASVNQTQAKSVLSVVVSSSSYSLSNQQVWLNESGGTSVAGGTYAFATLIGSVINRALLLNVPQYTKGLQGSGQYTYPNTATITLTASPPNSAYSGSGSVPTNSTPTYNNNGGGVSFSNFGSPNDNILQLTNAQIPALLSSSGSYAESESLWVTGFPVYDQQSPQAKTFALLSAGGAYEVVFGKPIQTLLTNGGYNKASFTLLGQNWTIINSTGVIGSGANPAGQTSAVAGGQMYLASSLSPLTTVYVGKNITSGAFTVQLTDLGQPANGVSTASINVYYNGALTNTSQVSPGTTAKFNVTGHILYLNVNSTFAGLYAYQKWAKMQLYSNVFKLVNGNQFNKTYDKGWNINMYWTNTTVATGGNPSVANALYAIMIWNTSPVTLVPGGSLTYITQPQAWKLTFVGETLGSGSFDPVTLTSSFQSAGNPYQNLASGAALGAPTISNFTEPEALLTVTSQIPGAFTYAGQQSSSVNYLLNTYQLFEQANAVGAGATPLTALSSSNVILSYTNINGASWINANAQLTVQVSGWTVTGTGAPSTSKTTQSVVFSANSGSQTISTPFYNVTSIQISRPLPVNGANSLSIAVWDSNALGNQGTTPLATLGVGTQGSGSVIYQQSNLPYQSLSQTALGNTLYNNGGVPTSFTLTQVNPSGTAAGQYYQYSMQEIAVPQNTLAIDTLTVGIDNTTAGVQATPVFQLNYSASNLRNNITYTPVAYPSFSVIQGFRTERGSKVAAITPGSVTINFAKQVDMLQFAIGPANATAAVHSYKLYGPYGVGQATNLPNVSIGQVTANVTVAKGANVSISGIGSIQAIPSVSSASTPVLLTGLSGAAPIAVLDSGANPSSNLILIGSGFVNTLSQQLQNAYNITFTPSSAPIMQAYGTNRILIAGYSANQTTTAANNFIQQLYAAASV